MVDAPHGNILHSLNISVHIFHQIRSCEQLCFFYQLKTIATPTAVASTEEQGQCRSASDTVAEVEQHQKDLCLTRLDDEARLKHLSTRFGFGRRTKQFESRSQESEANRERRTTSGKCLATQHCGAQCSQGMSAVGSTKHNVLLLLIENDFLHFILLWDNMFDMKT